jgi:tetratricopeptide (TPR) repeat protein
MMPERAAGASRMKTLFFMLAAVLSLSVSTACRADNSQDLAAMGISAFGQHNYKLAIGYFNDAVKANTNYMGAYYYRGLSYMGEKKYDQAIADLSRALLLNSNDWKAYYFRGWSYSDNHQYQHSIADLDRALSLETNTEILLLRATVHTRLTNYSGAIADYNLMLQRDPASALGYLGRANVFNMEGAYGSAIMDCNLALLVNQALPGAYKERGEAYEGEGHYDLAIADYNKVIGLAPMDPSGYAGRAVLFADEENYSNALADCSKAISLDPGNAGLYDSRGLYYAKTGNYGAAIQDSKTAIALEPDNASPYNNLAWLLAVTPDAKWRDGKKALEYAKKACDLTQWNEPAFVDTLAAAYAESGDFTNAVKWESKVIGSMSKENQEEAQKALHLYQQGQPYREK